MAQQPDGATVARSARGHIKPTPESWFFLHRSSAEMRFEAMARPAYLTDTARFYVRNLGTATPFVDVASWRLRVHGDGVARPLDLSYDDLLALPSRTVTRFLECAGNGRAFYDLFLGHRAPGSQWKFGGFGIAEWRGVPLAEILDRAGLKREAVDVMPVGLDAERVARPMPIGKALAADTLLVYAMNGAPLLPDHGFPARLLVPGWVGSASIKWVGEIVVATHRLFTPWNTTSYILKGPLYPPDPPAEGQIVTQQRLKSAVALPWPATLPAGRQTIVGYAWSPVAEIARVAVSLDGGQLFHPATLTGPNIAAAGSRWEFTLDARPGPLTITPRATDAAGNCQPRLAAQPLNDHGYLFGAAVPHPVTVVG